MTPRNSRLSDLRDLLARQLARRRAPRSSTPPTNGNITGLATGTTRLVRPLEPRDGESRFGMQVMAIVLLLALLAVGFLGRLQVNAPAPITQFVVLVAPFADRDGQITQTGRQIARDLVAALRDADASVTPLLSNQEVRDAATALALARQTGADVVIWGRAEVGVLDQPVLQPELVFQPSGPFAPHAWAGYHTRIGIPAAYALSSAPLNGRVVLVPLMQALAACARGDSDSATTLLESLLERQRELRPALPRALLGTMRWARGDFRGAAEEFQAARADAAYQPAVLAVNQSVALQDAGDVAAAVAVLQEVASGGDIPGQMRVALAHTWLNAHQPERAVAELDAAASQLPGSVELLLLRARAYRETGRYEQAGLILAQADGQLVQELARVPVQLASVLEARLRGAIAAEEAQLALARQLPAPGPLLWALERAPTLSAAQLEPVRGQFQQAITWTEDARGSWGDLSLSEDASGQKIAGLTDAAQANQLVQVLAQQQVLLAATDIELARTEQGRTGDWLSDFWTALVGDNSPMTRAQRELEALLGENERNIAARQVLARSYRLQGRAEAMANQAAQLVQVAPDRPEGYYAQAMAALIAAQPDRPRAVSLLQQAVAASEWFFPAREELARLALADQRWEDAIVQLRWLAEHRPSGAIAAALGDALRQSGPAWYGEAEAVLLPWVNRDQPSALALVALGRLYRAAGQNVAAEEALSRAVNFGGGSSAVQFELAQLLESRGELAAAVSRYQVAAQIDPGNMPAHLALARLYSGPLANPEAAAASYQAAVAAGATDPEVLRALGDTLLALGRPVEAADAYGRVAQIRSDDAQVQYLYGQASLQAGRFEQATAALTRAIELRGGVYPEALAGLAEIDRLQGRVEEAFRRYNEALTQNPNLADAYIGLGRAAAQAGDWDGALTQFQIAVQRTPESATAHYWLGEAYRQRSDWSRARDAYQQASVLAPGNPEPLLGLARSYVDAPERDLPRALTAIEAALARRPDYAEAYLLLGRVQEEQGEPDDTVLPSYTRAIQSNGRLAEPYYRRALVHIRAQRYAEAENDLRDAVRLQDSLAEAHFWLGRVEFARGRTASALRSFQAAINRRGGTYPEARYYQGLAEERLGQRQAASASFTAALEQDPRAPWAGDAQIALSRVR